MIAGYGKEPTAGTGSALQPPARDTDDWSRVLEFLQGRAARVTVTAVAIGAVAGGAAAYLHSGKTVTLTVDGASRTVDADADTVQALLADEHVPVSSRDIVAPGLNAPVKDGEQVVVRYARQLTVTVDGVRRTYWTTALTVDDALNVLNIRADGARLSASRSMPLGRQGLDLAISTPKLITLTADGTTRAVRTTAQTVAQLLAEQGVKLDGDDKLSVAAGDAVVNMLAVKVTRISHRHTALVETVPFSTIRTTSSKLYVGQTKVVTKGKPGTKRAVYDVVRTNGKKTGKTFVSASLLTAPVDQVVQVGTKHKPAPASTSGSGKGGRLRGRRRRRPELARAGQVRVRRQPARGQPRRVLRPLPVQRRHLAHGRRQRQPDQRLPRGAALPRQTAVQARRRRAVGLRPAPVRLRVRLVVRTTGTAMTP